MNRNLSSRGFRQSSNRGVIPEELQIKDLDLELELLRRKREILEQKAQQYSGQGHYDSPRFQDSHSSHSNYGQFSGKKRYSGEVEWSVTTPPKRVSVPRRGTPKQFGLSNDRQEIFDFKRGQSSFVRQEQKNNRGIKPAASTQQSFRDRPIPLMSVKTKSSIIDKYKNKPGKSKPKDFQPTKVTKNKFGDGNKTTPAFLYGAKIEAMASTPDSDDPILRADKVPTQQMAGRLELALGNIMKTIRTNYSKTYADCFDSHVKVRNMKQLVRQRLRNVMIGKAVGIVTAIVDNYRKVYPIKTDIEIVNLANDTPPTEDGKETMIMDEDNLQPNIYFKNNFAKLLDKTLDEMFAKLAEDYAGSKQENLQPIIEAALKADDDNKGTEDKKDNEQDFTVDESVPSDDKNVATKCNELTKSFYYDKLIKKLLHQHLPEVLPKYKTTIIKVMNINKFYKRTKSEIKERTGRLIRYHGEIDGTDDINEEFKCKTAEEEPKAETNDAAAVPKPTSFQRLPYYVKIVGRPALPKRNVMQTFLDEFNPKSIKKVKQMGNLLFVGFDNKEDFDKIVEANNTVLGNNKLIIKISKWVTKEALDGSNSKEQNGSEVAVKTEDKLNESIGSVSLQSIDDQIDNLLTSIRKEEETSLENNKDSGEFGDNATSENTEMETETTKENSTVENTEQLEKDKPTNELNETKINEEQNMAQDNKSEKTEDENFENNIEINEDVTGKEEVEGESKTEDVNTINVNADTINADDNIVNKGNLEDEEKDDKVGALKINSKESGTATPTRSSSRLANATPSNIRTRRASRLAQDN
ncbi:uncharacterized protein ACR2FA_002004 [Aphomia sociella]